MADMWSADGGCVGMGIAGCGHTTNESAQGIEHKAALRKLTLAIISYAVVRVSVCGNAEMRECGNPV